MVILQLTKQPTIIQAIFCDDLDELYNYASIQNEINYEDSERRTPLHAAAFKGDPQMVEVLLIGGAKINAKDNKWLTPLHRACRSGSDKVSEVLLRNKAEPLARNRHWQTPIHLAATSNSVACLKQLAEVVKELNIRDRQGRTPLHYASHMGHTQAVQFLVEKGCVVNARDCHDNTPLHLAAMAGHLDAMELLVNHGADIEAKEMKLYTALNIAAGIGHQQIVQFLLKSGSVTNTNNYLGNTPLHTACLNGHAEICLELVLRDSSLLNALNNRSQTPLHVAIESDRGGECLEYLLRLNVNVNAKCILKRTTLHEAVARGRDHIFEVLLLKGALIHEKDTRGSTIMHYAAMYGQESFLADLIKKDDVNVNLPRNDGMTALHLACAMGHANCCSVLLNSGADVNVPDNNGKTAVHWAILGGGGVACLEVLVAFGAKIGCVDADKRNAIHYAALMADFDCLLFLDGFQFPLNCQDKFGCTPLQLASASDHIGSCIKFFLRRIADITLCDNEGYTCLHYAVRNGNHKILPKLFQAFSPLLKFFEQGNGNIKITPLHLAARHGHWECLEELLLQLMCCIDYQTEKGSTALMLACKHGHERCVQLLLQYCGDVTIRDCNGMTALHHCAKQGKLDCLRLFFKNRVNADGALLLDGLDNEKQTALMWAVVGNHSDCAEMLLKGLANPNCMDGNKFTALYKAICLGNVKIVELLLLFGANTKIRDKSGKTVIHAAAICGNYKCLELLVKHFNPEDAKITDANDFTILHWVANKGNYCCLKYLLETNIFTQFSGHAFSPLHCAATAESAECLELLLKYYSKTNSDFVNLQDHRNRTIVMIIAQHGHVECFDVILKYEVNFDAVDKNNTNCVMIAALNGHEAVLGVALQRTKLNIMMQDLNGNTALHFACMGKRTQCALHILQHIDENVNTANNLGKTCLHLAAQNGLVEVVEKLIEKGASITELDHQGLPAIFYCSSNEKSAKCMNALLNKYLELKICPPPVSSITIDLIKTKLLEGVQESVKKSHTSMKYCRDCENLLEEDSSVTQFVQTDITMVKNPDKFECEQFFHLKRSSSDKADKKLLSSKIFASRQKSLASLEPCANKDRGLPLHKSTSDISIVKQKTYCVETYNKIVKNSSDSWQVRPNSSGGGSRRENSNLETGSEQDNRESNQQLTFTNAKQASSVQQHFQQLRDMRKKVCDLKREIRTMSKNKTVEGRPPTAQIIDFVIGEDENSWENVDETDKNTENIKDSVDFVKEQLDLSLKKLELGKLRSFLNDIVSEDKYANSSKEVVTHWKFGDVVDNDTKNDDFSNLDSNIQNNKRKFDYISDDFGEIDTNALCKEFKKLHTENETKQNESVRQIFNDGDKDEYFDSEEKCFLARSPTFLSIPGVFESGFQKKSSDESLNNKLSKLSVQHNETLDSRDSATCLAVNENANAEDNEEILQETYYEYSTMEIVSKLKSTEEIEQQVVETESELQNFEAAKDGTMRLTEKASTDSNTWAHNVEINEEQVNITKNDKQENGISENSDKSYEVPQNLEKLSTNSKFSDVEVLSLVSDTCAIDSEQKNVPETLKKSSKAAKSLMDTSVTEKLSTTSSEQIKKSKSSCSLF